MSAEKVDYVIGNAFLNADKTRYFNQVKKRVRRSLMVCVDSSFLSIQGV